MSVRASGRVVLLWHICAIVPLVLCATINKEYVCRDPDTGTLHEVNTTWRSTTFCGNYTCKIKLKNESQPSQVFVRLFDPQAKSNTNDKVNYTKELSLSQILPELSKENDRLLNKAEINKITELLHTVKKSDLQAVIELYNVAKDIYKDINVAETEVESRSNKAMDNSKNTIQHKPSYWYSPINEQKKLVDMNTEGSAIYPSASYAYSQPYQYATSQTNYPSLFTGSLLNDDHFRKIGQANTNRQALPPYYEPRSAYNVPDTTQQSPCYPCPQPYQYQIPLQANYPQRPTNMYPYPFPYNYTALGYNNYYKGNPWTFYDYYKIPHQKTFPMQTIPQVVAEKTAEENNLNIEAKKDDQPWKTDPLSEDIINEIRANIAQREKLINIPLKKRLKLERVSKIIKLNQNNRQTRSLSDKEDRAVSSEIVGKVNNEQNISSKEIMNTLNNKEKRSSQDVPQEAYETYVEKVTCKPATELGFFKIGNMTKPFPECCPQKIEDKQR